MVTQDLTETTRPAAVDRSRRSRAAAAASAGAAGGGCRWSARGRAALRRPRASRALHPRPAGGAGDGRRCSACSRSPPASCVSPAASAGNPLLKARSPTTPSTASSVTDPRGHVIYANSAYLDADRRHRRRTTCGRSSASSSAIPTCRKRCYRLLKAAREGKRLQEEVRVAGRDGEPGALAAACACGRSARRARDALPVWSVADITRDRERQENVFQELQHAIDYLDHAPAGFFSVDADRRARLSQRDAGRAGSTTISPRSARAALKLSDIVAGDGAALLTTHRGAPGEVKTEVLDIDLQARAAARRCRCGCFHKVAFGADGAPGASRTLVLNRARDEARRSAARRRSALHALLPLHADGDRDRRQGRPIVARQCALRQACSQARARRRRRSSILARRQRARPRRAGSGDRQAADGQGDIAPVEADAGRRRRALGAASSSSAVEEDERDTEAAIVYALETTDAARAGKPGQPARRRWRSVGQLAGGIAHDFNNVLSAIMMATDFLLERAQADRSVVPGHHADQAERQPRRGLVRQLLAFSRRQTLRPQVLDLGEVLSDLDHAAAAADRREGQARGRARPRPVAGQGRHLASSSR